jgi:hypothetical protein
VDRTEVAGAADGTEVAGAADGTEIAGPAAVGTLDPVGRIHRAAIMAVPTVEGGCLPWRILASRR